MSSNNAFQYYRPDIETASRESLREYQWERLRHLLETVFEKNPFYREKWSAAGVSDWREIDSFEAFQRLPFTTRDELSTEQESHPPYGRNLTWPAEKYTYWHHTSGKTGKPLIVLCSKDDWERIAVEPWRYNFAAVGVKPGDRLFILSPFGPFAGLWGPVYGAEAAGIMMMPGGGQTTLQRLQFIIDHQPTAVVSIPTYALRMAEVAAESGIDLASSSVRVTIHGGEPGTSVPSTRARIEEAWGAKSYDATGLSEVGHTGFECLSQSGVHIIESEYLIEVVKPGTEQPVPEGESGELVITTLGRLGSPVVRYRAGDMVKPTIEKCECGRTFSRLLGGIIGRIDDMITIRGVNIYPTAVENLIMAFPEVAEFRAEISEERGMHEIQIQLEMAEPAPKEGDGKDLKTRVSEELRRKLSLRAKIEVLPPRSIPRPPGKAYRFVRRD